MSLSRAGRGWRIDPAALADLVRLSVPIAVSRSSVMVMSLTDMIVLGRFRPEELPHVLNAWLPIGVSLGFGIGILGGVQVLTSELAGRGREGESGRILRRGLWQGLWIGLLLSALVIPLAGPGFRAIGFAPAIAAGAAEVTRILAIGLFAHMLTSVAGFYLEALRRPGLAAGIMYAGVAINLVLDLCLVTGLWGFPAMGASGVAWATTGTRLFLILLFGLALILFTPALKPAPPGPDGEGRRQLAVGSGGAISNIAEWGGFNATYVIATLIGLATASAYGLTIQVLGISFMLFLGIGSATSVRVAEAHGRADAVACRHASRLGVAATLLMGTLIGVGVLLLREPISAAMVRADARVEGVDLRAALPLLLAMAALVIVFDGLQAVGAMALRAQGVVWMPALIHAGSYFAIMLPACYALGLMAGRGAHGMMEGVLVASVFAGLAQWAWLERKTAQRLERCAAC